MHWRIERLKRTDHLNGMCHKTFLTNAVLTHFLGTYSVLTIRAGRKVRKTQNKKFAFHNHQSHTEAGASSHHCEFFPQLSPESRIFQDQILQKVNSIANVPKAISDFFFGSKLWTRAKRANINVTIRFKERTNSSRGVRWFPPRLSGLKYKHKMINLMGEFIWNHSLRSAWR